MQTDERVRIFWRFLSYSGAGILVSSIAALAVRFWLPEPSHMPLFALTHSLTGGVMIALLIRSLGKARTSVT